MMPWSPAPSSLLPAGIHALGDVGGLLVQQHLDLGVVPVEAVLLVADSLIAIRAVCAIRSGVIRLGPGRTSPAITTRLVVARVSQATRANG